MKARQYLTDIVLPLHRMLQENQQSLPLLYASVTTLVHMMDYIAAEAGKTGRGAATAVAREITMRFPDFRVLHSVAIAQKHAVVENVHLMNSLTADSIEMPGTTELVGWDGAQLLGFNDNAILTGDIGFHVLGEDGLAVDLNELVDRGVKFFVRETDTIVTDVRP